MLRHEASTHSLWRLPVDASCLSMTRCYLVTQLQSEMALRMYHLESFLFPAFPSSCFPAKNKVLWLIHAEDLPCNSNAPCTISIPAHLIYGLTSPSPCAVKKRRQDSRTSHQGAYCHNGTILTQGHAKRFDNLILIRKRKLLLHRVQATSQALYPDRASVGKIQAQTPKRDRQH